MSFGKDFLNAVSSGIDSQNARNISALKKKLRSVDDDAVRRAAENARNRGASGFANLAEEEARRRGL